MCCRALCVVAVVFSGCSQQMAECPVILSSTNASNKLKLLASNSDRTYSAVLVCGQNMPVLVGKYDQCLTTTNDRSVVASIFANCDSMPATSVTPTAVVRAWGDVNLTTSPTTTVSPSDPDDIPHSSTPSSATEPVAPSPVIPSPVSTASSVPKSSIAFKPRTAVSPFFRPKISTPTRTSVVPEEIEPEPIITDESEELSTDDTVDEDPDEETPQFGS